MIFVVNQKTVTCIRHRHIQRIISVFSIPSGKPSQQYLWFNEINDVSILSPPLYIKLEKLTTFKLQSAFNTRDELCVQTHRGRHLSLAIIHATEALEGWAYRALTNAVRLNLHRIIHIHCLTANTTQATLRKTHQEVKYSQSHFEKSVRADLVVWAKLRSSSTSSKGTRRIIISEIFNLTKCVYFVLLTSRTVKCSSSDWSQSRWNISHKHANIFM